MERRKINKQTFYDNNNNNLPGPSLKYKDKRYSNDYFIKNCIIGIFSLIFIICILYWLCKPSVYTNFHIHHGVNAQVDAVKDWLWIQVSQCNSIFNNLNIFSPIALGIIKNSDFNNGLLYWDTIYGNPSIKYESGDNKKNKNSFWSANIPSHENEGSLSCSSQYLNLNDINNINIFDSILNEPLNEQYSPENDNDKKIYLFHGLIDYYSILMNVSTLLRNNKPYIYNSKCGTLNHFCDRSFNDHIWFEIEFYTDFKRGSTLEGRNIEKRELLGSIRSLNCDSYDWKEYNIYSIIPPYTRYLNIKICGQHRSGTINSGMADDIKVNFFQLYDNIGGKHSIPCEIIKKPMLRETGQGSGKISIIWETDSYLRSQILSWGWEPGRTIFKQPIQTTYIDECHYIHKVNLHYSLDIFDDPIVNERNILFYRVSCGTTQSELYRYITPPDIFTYKSTNTTSSRIAIVSDNQYGNQVMRHISLDIQSFHPDLLLMAGDIVNRGYILDEWGIYFWYPLEVAQLSQQTPVVITRGNHDGQTSFAFAYTAGIINKDWFAFSYGVTRYIILDSNADSLIAPLQLEWLKNELKSKEYDEALFKIVMFHLPPFTELWSPKEGYNGEEFVRNDWVPLFEKYNVDIVINGHTHAYARGYKNNVLYTIVGGAGGMVDDEKVFNWDMFDVTISEHHYVIIDFNGCTLEWNVYDLSEQIIDSFTLTSKNIPNHVYC